MSKWFDRSPFVVTFIYPPTIANYAEEHKRIGRELNTMGLTVKLEPKQRSKHPYPSIANMEVDNRSEGVTITILNRTSEGCVDGAYTEVELSEVTITDLGIGYCIHVMPNLHIKSVNCATINFFVEEITITQFNGEVQMTGFKIPVTDDYIFEPEDD